jgi:hypothetical protein
MSIAVCGHKTKDPKHDHEIDRKAKRKRDRTGDIYGVLFKGVEETTVESKRRERSDEKIQLESEFFASCTKPRVGRFDRMPSFLYKPAYKNDQKVNDGKGVDEVVKRVDGADTKGASIDVGSRNEQLSLVKLQDDDDVQKNKKHRSKHYGNEPDAQRLKEILISLNICHPKDVVKRRGSKVVPVGVPVKMRSPKKEHHEHKDGPVKRHNGRNHREKGDILPHGGKHFSTNVGQHGIFSLGFLNHFSVHPERMLWECPFMDCIDPQQQVTENAIRRHYLTCHMAKLTNNEAKQALRGKFPVGKVKSQRCAGCKGVFGQKTTLELHQKRCI